MGKSAWKLEVWEWAWHILGIRNKGKYFNCFFKNKSLIKKIKAWLCASCYSDIHVDGICA